MRPSFLSLVLRVLPWILLTCTPRLADGALADYGVVAGTLVHDSDTNIETTKNPHLEPQHNEGKYPHYIFYLDTPAGRYQCVIDIFSRVNATEKKSINYRVVPLSSDPAWTSVLALSNGYHQLAMNSSTGALDYFRHAGINHDALTLAWKFDPNFVVGVNLPTFDALFKDARRVWAFGQPYTSGLGIHNIHQNQGNVPSHVLQAPQGPSGEDHSAANGLWQDGAVILEFDPIRRWVPGKHFWNWGHWVTVPNRKLLMTQFHVQEDFTFDATTAQDGETFKAGDGYTPLTLSDFKISAAKTIAAGGPPLEGQHSTSTGNSKKIRILVTPHTGHPVLYGRIGADPTTTVYDAKSDQPSGQVETIHAYSSSPQIWFWRVYNAGPGSCTFDWEEFDASL
jgi:hypothetical protein